MTVVNKVSSLPWYYHRVLFSTVLFLSWQTRMRRVKWWSLLTKTKCLTGNPWNTSHSFLVWFKCRIKTRKDVIHLDLSNELKWFVSNGVDIFPLSLRRKCLDNSYFSLFYMLCTNSQCIREFRVSYVDHLNSNCLFHNVSSQTVISFLDTNFRVRTIISLCIFVEVSIRNQTIFAMGTTGTSPASCFRYSVDMSLFEYVCFSWF